MDKLSSSLLCLSFALGACGGATSSAPDAGTPAIDATVDAASSPRDAGADSAVEPDAALEPDASQPDVDAGACPGCKRTFLTSTTFTGDLGGLAGGDALCAKLGEKLGGTFKAWLSDGTKGGSPSARFAPSASGYVRTDGVLVIGSFADLLDGKDILNPIDHDENGAPVTGANIPVWSNVNDNAYPATTAPEFFCQSWTSTALPNDGIIGYADAPAGLAWGDPEEWTIAGPGTSTIHCASQAHLYCFEQ